MEKIDDLLTEEVLILDESNDFFGNFSKANAISKFIMKYYNSYLKKNNIIGLFGAWGSGKSSIMKTINSILEKDKKFKCLWFDTWKYETDDNLPLSLFHFIINELNASKLSLSEFTKQAYALFKGIAKSVDYNISLKIPFFEVGTKIEPSKVLEEIEKYEEQRSITNYQYMDSFYKKSNEFYKEFNKLISKNKEIIIFIDDLDRCESENILKLLASLKLIFTNLNLIFICGIDKDAVELSLSNKYNNDKNKAEEFLEKIFLHTFSITNRKITNYDLIPKINSTYNKILLENLQFNNPRKIKKLYNNYFLIHDLVAISNEEIEGTFILYFIIIKLFYGNLFSNCYTFEKKVQNISKNLKLKVNVTTTNRDTKTEKEQVGRTLLYFTTNLKIGSFDLNTSKILLLFLPLLNRETTIDGFYDRDEKNYKIIELDELLAIFEDDIAHKFLKLIVKNHYILNFIKNHDLKYFEELIDNILKYN